MGAFSSGQSMNPNPVPIIGFILPVLRFAQGTSNTGVWLRTLGSQCLNMHGHLQGHA